ncbi:major facilitator superfamily domain-containing protein [Achaetomium macrosporum]|uniref:Major facilitator superfamily domain-containing protein n=1 Tax=Achaetomium macrosporum TaxID=79813 RepID=A0AAN7C096_9PEZI|nr:major facilitator superfamily domain-containing protein [Achaetomium macrosporum]
MTRREKGTGVAGAPIDTLTLQKKSPSEADVAAHDDSDGSASLSRRLSAASSLAVTVPDGGARAWLTVAGSTAAVTATFGIINSVGTFQRYLATHQLRSFSDRDVGWIAGVNLFLCLFLGVQCGPLFDRYGPRWLLAGASVVFVAGMTGMSFLGCSPLSRGNLCAPGLQTHRAYALLMLTWGVLCGAAAAVITTTALAVTAHWFDKRRGLAAGIVYAGSSVGGVAFPLLMRATLATLGWDWTVRIVMLIALALLLVANAFITGRTKELNAGRLGGKTKVIDLSCFRDMRFVWATLGIAMFEFVVSSAVGELPSWAAARGFDESTAFAFLAVYNAGSLVGRIVAGAVSDLYGSLNTVIAVLVCSIAVIYGLWIPVSTDRLVLFYVFAALFGMSTGSIMSMAPVCISQLCKPYNFGRYLGTSYSLVSFFCFFSIPVSAEILDSLGPRVFTILFGAFLSIALAAFCTSRWACLGYRWKWKAII